MPLRQLFTLLLCAAPTGLCFAQPDPSGIDFVTIGDVGNPDWTGGGDNNNRGGVDYEYRIGRFEVNTAQWAEFKSVYDLVQVVALATPLDGCLADPGSGGSGGGGGGTGSIVGGDPNPVLQADFDYDRELTEFDLQSFAAQWLEGLPGGDHNNSGTVDGDDVVEFLQDLAGTP